MARKSNHLHLWRRISQFFFLVALNPWFFLFRGFCFPAMNCWACPAAAFGCPVGGIGEMLAVGWFPFVTIGVILVAGAFVGRMICGWVCPFGLLQDLMAKITKVKLRLPKALSYLKYAVLVVMVLAIPLAVGEGIEGHPAYFCTFCPAGTLEAAIPVRLFGSRFDGADEPAAGGEVAGAPAEDPGAAPGEEPFPGGDGMGGDPFGGGDDPFGGGDLWGAEGPGAAPATDWMGGGGTPASGVAGVAGAAGAVTAGELGEFLLTAPRMWVLYAFLLAFVFIRRPFCRFICPIGAMFALLNRFSLFRLRVRKDKCKSCNLCAKSCPVDNKVYCSPSSEDCVRCLECVDTCKRGGVEAGLISVLPREDYWE